MNEFNEKIKLENERRARADNDAIRAIDRELQEALQWTPETEQLSPEQLCERFREDFALWARRCVRIKDKLTGRMIPFVLNRAQRRVLGILEGQRRAGLPVRIIMLKARQWGGSTLVQMYMAWIQCVHKTNWHSVICAQVAKTSGLIRGMYSDMLANYPVKFWTGEDVPRLNRYQNQDLIREINGRGCRITLGSSECPDSIRGGDFSMGHLSEVAFWRDTPKSNPRDFIRAICGSVARVPFSVVVLESTANGVGNYFHSEWKRSERGESDKAAVFVPWYEIDIYRESSIDARRVWEGMDAYERDLWNIHGLSLERIAWYQNKRAEYPDHAEMMAEYPTTAQEAFANTGVNVFSPEGVERLRQQCRQPLLVGEPASGSGNEWGALCLRGVHLRPDSAGRLKVWEEPKEGRRYVVSVDVGGRSSKADWSVVCVMRVPRLGGERPEVVAQWRGHIDHDLLTWRSAMIARLYNRAMLVFESNTLETDFRPGSEVPDQGAYMLNELYAHYPELYFRQAPEGGGPRPGFHTNRSTKQMIITELVAAVREGLYVERDAMACDELAVYQRRENGSYGASVGYHDDILMSRAIALHVILHDLGSPVLTAAEPCSAGTDDGADSRYSFFVSRYK